MAGFLSVVGVSEFRNIDYWAFQTIEVAVPRELFAVILERIQRFRVPPPLV
ncbi:MAG: hypothetical protein JSV19_08965 [Phycisphaerales bacterium]|nr:MAG: hypothetical protein JSV19_08965 [Phycisphaerales bacterium]